MSNPSRTAKNRSKSASIIQGDFQSKILQILVQKGPAPAAQLSEETGATTVQVLVTLNRLLQKKWVAKITQDKGDYLWEVRSPEIRLLLGDRPITSASAKPKYDPVERGRELELKALAADPAASSGLFGLAARAYERAAENFRLKGDSVRAAFFLLEAAKAVKHSQFFHQDEDRLSAWLSGTSWQGLGGNAILIAKGYAREEKATQLFPELVRSLNETRESVDGLAYVSEALLRREGPALQAHPAVAAAGPQLIVLLPDAFYLVAHDRVFADKSRSASEALRMMASELASRSKGEQVPVDAAGRVWSSVRDTMDRLNERLKAFESHIEEAAGDLPAEEPSVR